MSLYGLLTTSASGMSAQSSLLATIADNIANVDTTGYKEASTQFSSLVESSGVSDYQSGSVNVDPTININGQGTLTSTTSPTDLAIQGNGFFVVQGGGSQQLLTRAGSFVQNTSGNLVNSAGFTLLGYATGSNVLSPVKLSSALEATPTTSGQLYVNLPSNSTAVAQGNWPSQNTTTPTPTEKTSLVTYDNLGNPVTLDVYSTNEGNNTWEVDIYNAADATNGGFPYTNNGDSGNPLTSATLSFSASGALQSTTPSPITVAIPNGSTMTLDMSQTTQLATSYTVLNDSANGNAPSAVASVNIASDGTLTTVYQNGVTTPAWKIPLATVPSPNDMTVISGNAFEPNL